MSKTLLAALVAATSALAPAGAAASPCYDIGHAGNCPALVSVAADACPPRLYTCRMARRAFERFGEGAVVDRARTCGWSEAKIAEALKCKR
jgi:hypothetical protein